MGTKRYKRDFKALEQRRHKAAQLWSQETTDVNVGHLAPSGSNPAHSPASTWRYIEDVFFRLRVQANHTMLDHIGDGRADLVVTRSSAIPDGSHSQIVRLDNFRIYIASF